MPAITAAIYVPKILTLLSCFRTRWLRPRLTLTVHLHMHFSCSLTPLPSIPRSRSLRPGWLEPGLAGNVVVPDHEGPKAAFGAGHQAGKATLNGIRGA